MNFLDYFNKDAVHSGLMNFVRQSVLDSLPDAVEKISYNMPAWAGADGKVLFYAMATEKHLGLYPHPPYIMEHAEFLRTEKLKFSKGAIQVPFDYSQEKLSELIHEIITYNVTHNITR
ncbi:MAG: iron chaperone [Streptococcaceae bacterium]|jgi:uncharacterized protein YdhG (YjbR/CyaY superfamily)|nr:iron chaperone [Streptococcaceae bacterium]